MKDLEMRRETIKDDTKMPNSSNVKPAITKLLSSFYHAVLKQMFDLILSYLY